MVEFEHALLKLLLLVAVLSAKPLGRKWTPWIIAGGFLLALLPSPIPIPIPWGLVLGITIPLILWQNARRIIAAQWQGRWKDILIWVVSAAIFAALFLGLKEMALTGAILFGLVTASMIWSAGETEKTASVVSLVGPFTLIFLLAEVEPFVETPTYLMRGILSGLSFGAIIAFVAVFWSNKTDPKIKNWISIGQIYVAYGFAALVGVSAVAASLASVIVYVTVGLYINLWPTKRVEPTPLNTWPGFIFILVLFLLLGWEAHYSLSSLIVLEIAIVFLLSLMIAWIGQRLKLDAFPKNIPLWRIGLRVSLLIFPALLIWPRDTLRQPLLLVYAFGMAIINLVLAKITLDYFFEERGV